MRVKRIKAERLFFGAAGVVWLTAVVWLRPIGDDWNYHTMPNVYFSWRELLPQAAVWRPLDILFGALLGRAPWCFPWANRVLVVAGHVLGGMGVWYLLQRLFGLGRRQALLPTVFFLGASGAFTAVASVDGLNQVWSATFGILGFVAFCRDLYWQWAIWCLLAALAKESGLVWFMAVPLVSAACNNGRFRVWCGI